MTEHKKAWKPKSSFPKVRARSKRREGELSLNASVSVNTNQAFKVVERKRGNAPGTAGYQVITRDGRSGARKKISASESDADVSHLGQIDFRKRKRGK